MLSELMLAGLDFLLIGDAGALTVDAFKKINKITNNFVTFTDLQIITHETFFNGRNS